MFVIAGAIIGALLGGGIAKRRKGSLADILQYGFVYAMMFAILGLFITLFINRQLV
ncbi:hypothetical protein [Mesobacterium pallidum]|uniref:hypothetical protein n=1 Tax=Mesobacterium pallidum TaxID=2872037 RepID=UPI001EE1674B|nr:hypothetical protein [Mesobacterium pallidum]